MKNFSTIIILFAFLLVGIGGAVVAWKVTEGNLAQQAEAQYQTYVQKYRAQQAARPKPSATPTVSPTPTATPAATATSLQNEAQSLQDDGGAGDFTQMQTDINGL